MNFDRIQGHDIPVAVLKRALAAGRTGNGYLFEGPEGCGKKMAATAFIAALFCGREEACGVCSSCRKMASGQHPDLHVVEPDGAHIKIDQIRELQRALSLRPHEAKRKGCIIDGAEKMNISSANAFLKTLEEPPGDAVIILLTPAPDAVAETILSRCQRLRFAPLPQGVIEAHLVAGGTEPHAAKLLAAMSGGSIGRALALDEEGTMKQRHVVVEAASAFSLRKISGILDLAEQLGKEREQAQETLRVLESFLRDILSAATGCTDILNIDLEDLVRREAERLPLPVVVRHLEAVQRGVKALYRNSNPRLTLENIFMELASP